MTDEHNKPTEIATPSIDDPTPSRPLSARAQWSLRAKDGPFPANPDRCVVWEGNTRDVDSLNEERLVDLVSSIKAVGQTVPVIARICEHNPGQLEIIAGACRLAAIQRINADTDPTQRMKIIVDLRELDDEAALKVVDAENRGRLEMSQFEKAQFYRIALHRVFNSETALAESLGLNKSSVNRTLAITRLPEAVIALVVNRHEISAAQASGFMRDWDIPPLRETLSSTIEEMHTHPAMPANKLFKLLQEAATAHPQQDTADIVIDDVEYGSVRRTRTGFSVAIKATQKDLALRSLVRGLEQALKQLRY